MNNFDFNQWFTKFLNPSELQQYQKLCTSFTEQFWSEYANQWHDMFKKVEKNLNLDPKSIDAKHIYEEWMNLVNKAYGNYPDIREKIWEAYKMSLTDNMQYFNKKVIEFIDQVSKFYKI